MHWFYDTRKLAKMKRIKRKCNKIWLTVYTRVKNKSVNKPLIRSNKNVFFSYTACAERSLIFTYASLQKSFFNIKCHWEKIVILHFNPSDFYEN